jgi:RNA 2',3'-cyclic 3'-phosphodiesterase
MPSGATARLFVAIDPPVHVCEELAEWARAVAAGERAHGGTRAGLKLLGAQSLHLTLCFLASRPVGELDALAATVSACVERGCELSVGAPLWLPPGRPRALAVEIHDRNRELAHMQQRVSVALAAVSGWEPERRRFRPHVTLARVRGRGRQPRRAGGDRSGAEQPLPATPRLSFAPEAIVLYRSWLALEGASHQALARCEIARAR